MTQVSGSGRERGGGGEWKEAEIELAANVASIGAPYAAKAKCGTDGNTVQLTGTLDLSAEKAQNAVIGTLPEGYRPASKRIITVSDAENTTSTGLIVLVVLTNGQIQTPVALAATKSPTLDGVSFAIAP